MNGRDGFGSGPKGDDEDGACDIKDNDDGAEVEEDDDVSEAVTA